MYEIPESSVAKTSASLSDSVTLLNKPLSGADPKPKRETLTPVLEMTLNSLWRIY
jgi:hypothetical protein